ncbi:uncharacterized protein LOC114515623 [Dendronephthya gigantea]|uniref:uncharacterized protein LOC114515623 n=1 Tax=Dendronephthya gigantea TaxID=151771 RepID=UPI00106D3D48|nr:uncharacterized protein LOC114515623 [Dendronephthya gigantea]
MQAFANEEFKVSGEIIASSIVQGGPAACLFSSQVYDYIVHGISRVQAHSWSGQLQDESIKTTIEKIKSCVSNDDLVALLNKDSTMDVLQLIGYCGIPSKETMQTSDKIIRSLVITGVSKILTMVDQLISGLESYGVLAELRKNNKVMEPLVTINEAKKFLVTSDLLLDHLLIEGSPEGSNKKLLEINIHKFFCDYIQLVETREGNDLSALYKFITGAQTVTPLGMEKHITIKFKHGCEAGCRCRPTASTCDPSLTFPVHIDDSKQFTELMDAALAESAGFGFV